jgi:hypothetical protein
MYIYLYKIIFYTLVHYIGMIFLYTPAKRFLHQKLTQIAIFFLRK